MSPIIKMCFAFLAIGPLLAGCQESPLSALGESSPAAAHEAPSARAYEMLPAPSDAAQRAESGASNRGSAAVAGVNRKGTYRYGLKAAPGTEPIGGTLPSSNGERKAGEPDDHLSNRLYTGGY